MNPQLATSTHSEAAASEIPIIDNLGRLPLPDAALVVEENANRLFGKVQYGVSNIRSAEFTYDVPTLLGRVGATERLAWITEIAADIATLLQGDLEVYAVDVEEEPSATNILSNVSVKVLYYDKNEINSSIALMDCRSFEDRFNSSVLWTDIDNQMLERFHDCNGIGAVRPIGRRDIGKIFYYRTIRSITYSAVEDNACIYLYATGDKTIYYSPNEQGARFLSPNHWDEYYSSLENFFAPNAKSALQPGLGELFSLTTILAINQRRDGVQCGSGFGHGIHEYKFSVGELIRKQRRPLEDLPVLTDLP